MTSNRLFLVTNVRHWVYIKSITYVQWIFLSVGNWMLKIWDSTFHLSLYATPRALLPFASNWSIPCENGPPVISRLIFCQCLITYEHFYDLWINPYFAKNVYRYWLTLPNIVYILKYLTSKDVEDWRSTCWLMCWYNNIIMYEAFVSCLLSIFCLLSCVCFQIFEPILRDFNLEIIYKIVRNKEIHIFMKKINRSIFLKI